MQLYSGMSEHFVTDVVQNRIAEKLRDSFFRHFRFNPSPSEVNSWRNSLSAMAHVFRHAGLNDHGVLLEYQLPLTSKRLDCIVCGKDEKSTDNAVIVELKQWERCSESAADNVVVAFVGGAEREVLHPSVQVRQYQYYLEDTHTAFYEDDSPIGLRSCAYLHNYVPISGDHLFAPKFAEVVANSPCFTSDDVDPLSAYVKEQLKGGDGYSTLTRIEQSVYRPCKKLMEHVANVIRGNSEYVLLDEQRVVYESVLAAARAGHSHRKKQVIVVKGGPGTGKSVIALNLMADLSLDGYNAQYATGSRAFTESLRKMIGSRGAVQFKYFNGYVEANPNDVDVLICDEAHRIRETSNNRFTPKSKRSKETQIEELIHAAKVTVFLIDDKQVVRPNEIGSAGYIHDFAEAEDLPVKEYELEAQFRCAGSAGFVNWINNTLGIARTANVLYEKEAAFDFNIFSTPRALELAIRAKVNEGLSARMTAGFCWPWSEPNRDGTLVEDVVVGDYRRPWNAKSDKGRLAAGIPKETLWATDPNGINQVGCIYTAQGFEFDYVGVIFGLDLRYNLEVGDWEGHKECSFDTVVKRSKDKFIDLVKNTYRVLLSRGLKGCYVHFMDKQTEQFVRSRME